MCAALIRRAQPQDGQALSRLGETSFRETFLEDFAIPYPQADLAVFLRETYSLQATAAMIADPAQAVWIGETDEGAAGYAVAGPCSLPYAERAPGDGELKRLYVLRRHHGLGLGPRLMETALAWLEREHAGRLWIGVWSGNLRAHRFYARYGFSKFGEHEFPIGAWRDREFALRRG